MKERVSERELIESRGEDHFKGIPTYLITNKSGNTYTVYVV